MNPREENLHFPTFVNHFCKVLSFLDANIYRHVVVVEIHFVAWMWEFCAKTASWLFLPPRKTPPRDGCCLDYMKRCIRNCFLQHVKTTEKSKKYKTWNTNTFPDIFLAKRMSPWSSDAADSHTMQSLSLTLALMPNICNLWCNCCDFLFKYVFKNLVRIEF